MTITFVSVVVALVVGGIEALGLIAELSLNLLIHHIHEILRSDVLGFLGDYLDRFLGGLAILGIREIAVLPHQVEDDVAALRYALWFATDEAYNAALRAYSEKQAALKRFQTPPTSDDFTPAKAVVRVEPLRKLDIDEAEWKRRIVDVSGMYATKEVSEKIPGIADEVEYSSGAVRGMAVNRYLVNSDGTMLRTGYTGYAANVSVNAQAIDGMQIARSNGTVAAVAKEMESAEAFRGQTMEDLRTLHALRTAPIVDEEYHGPVLFSGDAAADIVNRLFVPNVEADKPEMGTNARTQGAYTSSYRSRVLPELLSAVDDPGMTEFAGRHLLGSYAVDDEGVPAERVDVVLNGLLQHYLIGRSPVKDVPESNGHGRAAIGQGAQSKSGVMVLKPKQATPHAAMETKLVAMAKDQKRDFVFAAETLAGELTPRLLYRVYPDGRRELVRGAVFDELDQRSLRSEILAAGDDPYVQQVLTPIPQATIVPSLLFGDIGVKRATQTQEKLPYYPPPSR